VAPFEVISRPLSGSTEEYHEKLQSGELVFGAGIQRGDLLIKQ
jgi:hypothetical protein